MTGPRDKFAPYYSPSGPRPMVSGVGRFADPDNPDMAAKFVLVGLRRRLTDDELRSLHEYLRGWKP